MGFILLLHYRGYKAVVDYIRLVKIGDDVLGLDVVVAVAGLVYLHYAVKSVEEDLLF